MSISLNVQPFQLGETLGATASTDYEHLEGKEYWFENFNPANGVYLHAGPLKVRIVRQAQSAFNIRGSRLVKYKDSARGREVDGYAVANDVECYPTDPYLPAAGVPANDLFYIIMDGLVNVERQIADTSADIAVGDLLSALTTSATSGSTTAGRLAPVTLTGSSQATDYLFVIKATLGLVGRALSTSATSAGATDVLLHVRPWKA